MSLQVCVLASGSSGNAIYVASDQTRLLIDAGLSARAITEKLNQIGVDIADINGICVSHEHTDHIAAVRVLQRRHEIPVYANSGTLEALRSRQQYHDLTAKIFTTGSAFNINDICIFPFPVPHDAYEPVGFRIEKDDTAVGVVTDLGMPTALVREKLRHCQAIIVESNHDEELLRISNRPWSLKQRIKGRQGHLSNTAAARLIADIASEQLEQVFLSHLSSDCNHPDTAHRTVSNILRNEGFDHIRIEMTYPDRISSIWQRSVKTGK